MAKTFDGPPTLERSGSEHRVGRFPSSRLRREDRDERWSFFNGKEGRDDFRKKSFLAGETERKKKAFINKAGRDDLHAKPF